MAIDQPQKTQLQEGEDVTDENFRRCTSFQKHGSKAGAIFGPRKRRFNAPYGTTGSSHQSLIKAVCFGTPTRLRLAQFDAGKQPGNSGTDPGDEEQKDTEPVNYSLKAVLTEKVKMAPDGKDQEPLAGGRWKAGEEWGRGKDPAERGF